MSDNRSEPGSGSGFRAEQALGLQNFLRDADAMTRAAGGVSRCRDTTPIQLKLVLVLDETDLRMASGTTEFGDSVVASNKTTKENNGGKKRKGEKCKRKTDAEPSATGKQYKAKICASFTKVQLPMAQCARWKLILY